MRAVRRHSQLLQLCIVVDELLRLGLLRGGTRALGHLQKSGQSDYAPVTTTSAIQTPGSTWHYARRWAWASIAAERAKCACACVPRSSV